MVLKRLQWVTVNSFSISHVGNSVYHSKGKLFHLNNILHVPQSCANLLSVYAFINANNISIKFFLTYFVIKDIHTRELLYIGPNDNRLYSMIFDPIQQAITIAKSFTCSLSQWHNCLGHANYHTIR